MMNKTHNKLLQFFSFCLINKNFFEDPEYSLNFSFQTMVRFLQCVILCVQTLLHRQRFFAVLKRMVNFLSSMKVPKNLIDSQSNDLYRGSTELVQLFAYRGSSHRRCQKYYWYGLAISLAYPSGEKESILSSSNDFYLGGRGESVPRELSTKTEMYPGVDTRLKSANCSSPLTEDKILSPQFFDYSTPIYIQKLNTSVTYGNATKRNITQRLCHLTQHH